ncbi:MAG TPA: integrin alpha [Rickettsia endosymbiont of Omalisus fontisbellaquei]|nr:integrin alpha [Rickettsia endosymbiont of Omalisus fontisbellaquei]
MFPESFTLGATGKCHNNTIILGENNNDQSGWFVAPIADLNGDGKLELLIAANAHPNNVANGATYVVSGASINLAAGSIPLANYAIPSSGIVRLVGENNNDVSGWSINSIGDLNGDGKPEVLIGTVRYPNNVGNGATYVVSGANINLAAGGSFTLTPGTGIVRLVGENNNDFSGWSINSIGDLNGDGKQELLIGAIRYPNNVNNGATYVVSGANINLAAGGSFTITPGAGIGRLVGENNGDSLGNSVSSIKDLNGDGKQELLIGAIRYPNGVANGATYVVSGANINLATGGSFTITPGAGIVRLVGENNNDFLGRSVNAIGDLNSDGKSELFIGAYQYPSGNRQGATYVVSGANINLAAGGSFTITPGAGIGRLLGENNNDFSGTSVL